MNDTAIAELIERRAKLRSLHCQILAEAVIRYDANDSARLEHLEPLWANLAPISAKADADQQAWIAEMCEGVTDD